MKDSSLTFDVVSMEVIQDGIEEMLAAGLHESLAQIRAECKFSLCHYYQGMYLF